MAEETLFDFTIPDFDPIVKGIKDTSEALSDMSKIIDKFQGAGTVLPADFVSARDAKQIVENIKAEIAGIIKLKEQIEKYRTALNESVKAGKLTADQAKEVTSALDNMGASVINRVVEMNNFARTITNTTGAAAGLKKEINTLYKDIDVSSVIKYAQKDSLDSEGVIARLRDIRSESDKTIENISMIGEALANTTNYQARQELQKSMQSFIGGMLISFEEERELSRQGSTNPVSSALASMKTLEQQAGFVSRAMKEASSPEEFMVLKDIFDDLTSSLTRQRDGLESYTKGLSGAQLEAMEFAGAGRSFADSITMAQKQLRELYAEIAKTQTLLKGSKTVEEQALFQARLAEQNKLLKEQQERLQALRQTRGIRGRPLQLDESGKPVQGMADLAGKLQQAAAISNSIVQAFIAAPEKAEGFSKGLVEITKAVDAASKAIQRGQSLKDSLSAASSGIINFGQQIKAQNDAILMSGKSLGISNKALGAFGSGVSGIGSLLGKVAGGIGLVTAGFEVGLTVISLYDAAMGKSEEQIKKNIEATKRQIEVQKKISNLIEEGSVDQLESERKRVQKEIDAAKSTIQELTESYFEGNAGFIDQLRSVHAYLTYGTAQVYGPAGDEINELNKRISELNDEAAALANEGLRDQIERTKELNDINQKADQLIGELEGQEKDLFNLRVDMFEKQGNLAEELSKIELGENSISAELAKAREDQFRKDFNSLTTALSDMEDDYGKEMLKLRDTHYTKLFDMEEDYNKSVAKAWDDLRKTLADIDKEFAESEAEALEQYNEQQVEEEKSHRKAIRTIEKDFEKERLERMKRAQEAMFQAELNNDALAFFNAQRQAKQEEKEAQKRREEQIVEQEKSFRKSKKKSAEQFAEERAEAAEQYEERKAEANAQHLETLANMKTQYDEEVALAKDQHKKDMAEAAKQYEERRVQEIEAFKKRQEDLAIQYAEEDALRADQNQKRRQELLETYRLELEYFKQREEILQQYIGAIQQTKTGRDQAQSLISDRTFTREEFMALRDTVLQPVMERLSSIPVGSRTEAEAQMYDNLYNVFEEFSMGVESIAFTPEKFDALAKAIDETYNRGLVEFREGFQFRLDYGGTDREGYAEYIAGLEEGASILPKIFSDLNTTISGLVTGLFGPTTQRELDAQGQRTQNELERTGTETYQAVQQGFNDIYDYEVGQYQTRLDTERQALDDRVRYGEYYWDETNQTFSDQYGNQLDMQETFGDDALYIQQMMNSDMLSTTAAGNDMLLGNQSEFQDEESNMRVMHGRQLLTQEQIIAQQRQMMIQSRAMSEAQAIVGVYSLINRNIVAGATYALGQLTAALLKMSLVSLLSGGRPFNPFTTLFGGGGGTGGPITLAAEGGYFNKPTPAILSEGRTPGELAVPFTPSRGIPDNISQSFGESLFSAAQKYARTQGDLPYSLPFSPQSSSAVYGDTITVQFGDITVGSEVSRAEVGRQMENLGILIADKIMGAKMPTGNRKR